jgi:hypothetical protein
VVGQHLARGRRVEAVAEVRGVGRLAAEEVDPVLQSQRDVRPAMHAVVGEERAHAVRDALRLEPRQPVAPHQPAHARPDDRHRLLGRDLRLDLRQQLGEDERVALQVVGRVGEIEHDQVVAAAAQVLDQVLLVEQLVELVPAHRVVDVEAFEHDDRFVSCVCPGASAT